MDKATQKEIFVFGSNTAGIHGAGAAFHAFKFHGAEWGVGYGLTGNTFAIPTKGGTNYVGKSLTVVEITRFVLGFLMFAEQRPDLKFKVTRIGCGLAGFKDEDIARIFYLNPVPNNVFFDTVWKPYLSSYHKFWGTF